MSDIRATTAELEGARALREWITGERADYARVFFIERCAMTDDLEEVVDADDVLLLPEDSGPYTGRAGAVRYSGDLSEIGDELFIGERSVELQDYIAAAFVQIVGPTAVCFFDESSWGAFVDDAELARRTGVFPTALIDPRILLADRAAIERPEEFHVPNALRVSRDGVIGVGVRGRTIGRVDELKTLLTVPLPRAAARRGAASGAGRSVDLAGPSWIGRYLAATDLMKMLDLVNGEARISGFGWSLIDDERADAEPLRADPFLIETADGFVLADITTLRRQLLAPTTADVVAVTQSSSGPELAAERVARHLGLSVAEARILCREAISALGIHFGTRTEPSGRMTGSAA